MSFSQPDTSTTQNGFPAIPCFLGLLVVLALVVVVYHGVVDAKKEVTAEVYGQFSSIAAKSCSGTAYLKSLASAGPILDGDAGMVKRELQRLADAQLSAAARAKITNSTVACA